MPTGIERSPSLRAKSALAGFPVECAMNTLVIVPLHPLPETHVQLRQILDRLKHQALLEVALNGSEEALDFAFAPGVIGLGMDQTDTEVGTHTAQMVASE